MSNKIFIPQGSYLKTAENIRVTLYCKARKLNGTEVDAQFDLTDLEQADIENDNGTLRNTGRQAAADGFVPGGSYKASCTGIRVMLTCRARRIDGSMVDVSFVLSSMKDIDLVNADGRLLDMKHIEDAHSLMGDAMPGHQDFINTHKANIIGQITQGTTPSAPVPQKIAVADAGADFHLTPCMEACATVFVDMIFVGLGLMGIKVKNNARVTRTLLRELGQDTINGLPRLIHDFSNATSPLARAKILWSIFSGGMKASMLKAVLKELYDQMSWWDWTKSGVIAAAQIAAWVASDGIAFIAEVALVLYTAEQLVEDAAKAVEVCAIA